MAKGVTREKQIAHKAALHNTLMMDLILLCLMSPTFRQALRKRSDSADRPIYRFRTRGTVSLITLPCRAAANTHFLDDPGRKTASPCGQLLRPLGSALYGLDQGYPQPALFQLQDAVDGAACGRGDGVLQQRRVVAGFQYHARGARYCKTSL